MGLPALALRQTDCAGVLLGERHQNAGDRGGHFAGDEHRAEHHVSRCFFSGVFKTADRPWPRRLPVISIFSRSSSVFRLRYGALGTMQIFRSFARIVMCSLVMGVFCWFGARYTEFTIHSQFYRAVADFSELLISGATVIYLAMAWIFKLHEIEEVYGIALRNRPAAGRRIFGIVKMEFSAAVSAFLTHVKVEKGLSRQYGQRVPAGSCEISVVCAKPQNRPGGGRPR